MLKRVAFIAWALLLTSCGSGGKRDEVAAKATPKGEKIECALSGAKTFATNCATEIMAQDDGQVLVIRHPGGGFRRFKILTDGRGLEAADGFDPFSLKIIDGGRIEVQSGGDIYRLPASIKASEPAAQLKGG